MKGFGSLSILYLGLITAISAQHDWQFKARSTNLETRPYHFSRSRNLYERGLDDRLNDLASRSPKAADNGRSTSPARQPAQRQPALSPSNSSRFRRSSSDQVVPVMNRMALESVLSLPRPQEAMRSFEQVRSPASPSSPNQQGNAIQSQYQPFTNSIHRLTAPGGALTLGRRPPTTGEASQPMAIQPGSPQGGGGAQQGTNNSNGRGPLALTSSTSISRLSSLS